MKLPSFKEIFEFLIKTFLLYAKLAIAAVIFISVVLLVVWPILQII